MGTKTLGDFGERKACEYLQKHGYTIIDTQYTSRFGEIDIIATYKHFVVFVEVKLRKNNFFAALVRL